jgi:hypothetical protein
MGALWEEAMTGKLEVPGYPEIVLERLNSKGRDVGFEFRTKRDKLWAGYRWLKMARVWVSPMKHEVAVNETFELELKTDFELNSAVTDLTRSTASFG